MSGTIYGHKIQGMRATVGDTLLELGKENEKIVVIDSETAVATNIMPFKEELPGRFLTTAIAEQCAISLAFGLQRCGYIPFVPLFAAFLTRRALDQIFVQAGYPNANIKMLGCYAGITAASVGATHQAFNDIAIMSTIPNMTVIEAADYIELHQAIRASVAHEGPVYIRVVRSDLPQYETPQLPQGYQFKIGKAAVLRQGEDITLVGSGIMVARCLETADKLAQRGISAEVINVSTIKPFDRETIVRSVRKTKHVVTAENNTVIGGLGSAVAKAVGEECPAPIGMVGIQDRFGHSAVLEHLLKEYNLTAQDILAKALEVVKK